MLKYIAKVSNCGRGFGENCRSINTVNAGTIAVTICDFRDTKNHQHYVGPSRTGLGSLKQGLVFEPCG